MNYVKPEIKLKVVKYYLRHGSLRKTAQKFGVNYKSVYNWVKLYKNFGEQKLLENYFKPWNRTPEEIESEVVLLKEKEPGITLEKARKKLKEKGINLSLKGIWSIWKRYGYTGFKKENITESETVEYKRWTKEAKIKYRLAEIFFKKGKTEKAIEIINSIPCLPENELLLKIPDEHLTLRKRTEKLLSCFGKIPLKEYILKLRSLYRILKNKKMIHSAFIVGTREVTALAWMNNPDEELRRIEELKKLAGALDSYSLLREKFILSLLESEALFFKSEIEKAYKIVKKCENIIKSHKNPNPHLMRELAVTYAVLEDFRKAEFWFLKAMERMNESSKRKLIFPYLGEVYLYQGKYEKAIKLLKDSDVIDWIKKSWELERRAYLSLIKGRLHRVLYFSKKYLETAKDRELNTGIINSSILLSCAYHGVGELKKSREILERVIPFLSKKGHINEVNTFKIILGEKLEEDTFTPAGVLAILLRQKKYREALKYAEKKGLKNLFYLYSIFFHDAISGRLKKGKKVHLPRTILRLPIFNKNIFVFNIKFLGKLVIYRNLLHKEGGIITKEYISHNFSNKEKAFLIHLALRIPEPGKEIPLEKIYRNFWLNSKTPSKNLSRYLISIRKQLKIPQYLFKISRKRGKCSLINQGIYFITDYFEYKETISRAKALLRTGEWEIAKKEFLNAFKLIRDEPFKKMYDRWSEDIRLQIIFDMEKNFTEFIKNCIKFNEKKLAHSIQKKAMRIIRYSTDIKNLV